jgi:ATP-dependent DNA ligase
LGNSLGGWALARRVNIRAPQFAASFNLQQTPLLDRLPPSTRKIRKTQPYAKKIAHKAFWVEPELLAEIEYRAKSAEGKVRHPFFMGLREDV